MNTAKAVRDVIPCIVNNLKTHPWVSKIYLYGSCAAGTNSADSDIDIAVFLEPDKPCGVDEFIELNRMAGFSDFDVQLQVFSEDELDDPCGIVDEIVSFGIVMYDKRST